MVALCFSRWSQEYYPIPIITEINCDPTIPDILPLHMASSNGHLDIVKYCDPRSIWMHSSTLCFSRRST